MGTNDSMLEAAGHQLFKTILADCPWPSASHVGKRDHWLKTNIRPRYHTMSEYEIRTLPVHKIADDDAMLVLWSTWMHLDLALDVIKCWGFKYCTGMPWLKVCQPNGGGIKPIYGPGVWFQHCTELILLGRRGHPFGSQGNPRPARKGIVISPRGPHSGKPAELQDWITGKFPGPRIELFARQRREGWTSWGDELR